MPVRHLLAADIATVAPALADAFADDPLMAFLYPDPARRRPTLTAFFDLALRAGLRRGHTYITPERTGAAIWAPPDVAPLDRADGELIDRLMAEYDGEEGLARMGAFAAAARRHHPRETPHFYLFIAGVAPPGQGRGAGSELLAPVLASCDRDGRPAYLESSNVRNVPFYERLGFEVRSEILIDGGPVVRGMWRAPRGSDDDG